MVDKPLPPRRLSGRGLLARSHRSRAIAALPESTPPAASPPAANPARPAFPDSLITDTPQAGIELAPKIARLNVAAIQTDVDIRKRLRPHYAESSEQLIAAAQVTATYFDTIAQANGYWR